MVGYRISDFDVVFYGDTAVASFVLDADYAFGGPTITRKLTLLDVYNKGPQGWIQVASNTSLHPDEVDRMASQLRPLDDQERGSLMNAREAVWRAWFAGDTDALSGLLPPELITLEPNGRIRHARVHDGSYDMDLQNGGKTNTHQRGTAVEVFVRQHGRWLNTGWQLAPVQK